MKLGPGDRARKIAQKNLTDSVRELREIATRLENADCPEVLFDAQSDLDDEISNMERVCAAWKKVLRDLADA
jgi:hypothetical protein